VHIQRQRRHLVEGALRNPERGLPSQPVACEFRTQEGDIVFVSDAPGSASILWISSDNGETWRMSKGTIAGIHAGVVQLNDGRLMAFGRGNNIDEKVRYLNQISDSKIDRRLSQRPKYLF